MGIMDVFTGFSFLYVITPDLEKWCDKYDLETFECKCSACGRNLKVNKPFAAKNRRGLVSDKCECGNTNVPFSYIDTNFDEVNLNSL